jgi:hypothetical protein
MLAQALQYLVVDFAGFPAERAAEYDCLLNMDYK